MKMEIKGHSATSRSSAQHPPPGREGTQAALPTRACLAPSCRRPEGVKKEAGRSPKRTTRQRGAGLRDDDLIYFVCFNRLPEITRYSGLDEKSLLGAIRTPVWNWKRSAWKYRCRDAYFFRAGAISTRFTIINSRRMFRRFENMKGERCDARRLRSGFIRKSFLEVSFHWESLKGRKIKKHCGSSHERL